MGDSIRSGSRLVGSRAAWLVAALLGALGTSGTLRGAETLDGYAQTKGGEGGKAVEVTTLDDAGPGSFRAALAEAAKGPAMITFKVGGTIYPRTSLSLTGSNITIDGSTAPAPGITLSGRKLGDLNTAKENGEGAWSGLLMMNKLKQTIIRNIRVRDTLTLNMHLGSGCQNVIFDHVSSTHCSDGSLFINPSTDITLRYCLFGFNALNLRMRGDRVSIHHCLFTNNSQRQPFIRETAGVVDYRNNVIQKWSGYGISYFAINRLNLVNNWFDVSESGRKPSEIFMPRNFSTTETEGSSGGRVKAFIEEQKKKYPDEYSESGTGSSQVLKVRFQVHASGNAGPASGALAARATSDVPYEPQPNVVMQTAEEARKLVLAEAGALPRDEIDKALAEGRATGHIIGKGGGKRTRNDVSEVIGVKGVTDAAADAP